MSDQDELFALAHTIAQLSSRMRTQARASQASYRSVDLTDGPVSYYDDMGAERLVVGAQGENGEFTTLEVNSPPPPQPTEPTVTPIPGGVLIEYDGTFVDANMPLDWARTEIHVGDAAGFEKTDLTQVSEYISPYGGRYAYMFGSGVTRHVALVAVNNGGVESISSVEVEIEAGIIEPETDGIAPDAVVNLHADGGVKSIFLTWDPVVNQSPVWYNIYGGTIAAVPRDVTHYIGRAAGNRFTIYQVFDDVALETAGVIPGVEYFFVVEAEDDDDKANGSNEAVGSPDLVTGPDIAANAVTTNHLQANSVTADQLEAVMVIATELYLGMMHFHPSTGITIPQNGTDDATHLAADGTGNQFAGGMVVNDGLTAYGGVNFQGVDNFLAGEIKAGSGINDPQQAPIVTTSYDTVATGSVGYQRRGLSKFHDPAVAVWITTDTVANASVVQAWSQAGGGGFWTLNISTGWTALGGVINIGNYYYALIRQNSNTARWKIEVRRGNDKVYMGSWTTFGAFASITTSYLPMIGTDGTNVVIAWVEGGELLVRKFLPFTSGTPLVQTGNTLNCGAWFAGDVVSVQIIGTVAFVGYVNGVRAFNLTSTTGTRDTGKEFPKNTGSLIGAWNDGVKWITFTSGTTFTLHTALSGEYGFSYDWTDADSGGSGIAHTKPSPTRIITPAKFSKWTVTIPSKPQDDLTNDGANTARIFAAKTPLPQVFQHQLVTDGDGVTGTPLSMAKTFSTIATSGAAPNTVNDFASRAGSIGRLSSSKMDGSDPMWKFDGDGSLKLGKSKMNSSGVDATDVWTTMSTFTNGWTVVITVQYRKDFAGNIHIRGVVAPGSNATSAFTLPVGYRPSTPIRLPTYAHSDKIGRITIDPTGTVTLTGEVGFTQIYLAHVFSPLS